MRQVLFRVKVREQEYDVTQLHELTVSLDLPKEGPYAPETFDKKLMIEVGFRLLQKESRLTILEVSYLTEFSI